MEKPEKVAEGALNRLCAYDAIEAPIDYVTTMERIAIFQAAFARLSAQRLFNVALKVNDGTSKVPQVCDISSS